MQLDPIGSLTLKTNVLSYDYVNLGSCILVLSWDFVDFWSCQAALTWDPVDLGSCFFFATTYTCLIDMFQKIGAYLTRLAATHGSGDRVYS